MKPLTTLDEFNRRLSSISKRLSAIEERLDKLDCTDHQWIYNSSRSMRVCEKCDKHE